MAVSGNVKHADNRRSRWRNLNFGLVSAFSTLAIVVGGFLTVPVAQASVVGATPSYPTISGSTSPIYVAVGQSASAGSSFVISDASSVGWSSVISRASVTNATLSASSQGSATVTGSGTSSVTITGSMSDVQAVLNSLQVNKTGSTAGKLTVTIEPNSKFTAGGNTYYFWNSNGHYYRYFTKAQANNASTRQAFAEHAQTTSFAGAGGYLITLTGSSATLSAAEEINEQDFIISTDILSSNKGSNSFGPNAATAGLRCSSAPTADSLTCTGTNSSNFYWLPGANAPSHEKAKQVLNTSSGTYPWNTGEPNNSARALVYSGWVTSASDTFTRNGQTYSSAFRWDDYPDASNIIDGGIYEFGNNTSFSPSKVTIDVIATYTVTYSYNSADGGERPASATFTVGGSPINLPSPTRLGYVFNGWYAESGLSTLVGAAGAGYSPTASTTLYAKWTNSLIVDLDATEASSYSGTGTTWNNIAPGASPANATLDSAAMYSPQFGGVMDTNNRKAITAAKSLTLDNSVGFTMEVWARFNSVSSAQGVASYDGGGRYINFYKHGNSGMRWEVSISSAVTDPTPVVANTWYHYVGTCKNNIATLYRNGQQVVSAARTCTTSQNAEFLVGNIQGIPMDGSISLFRFYTSALTDQQVEARFNTTKARTTYTVTYAYDSATGGNSTASAAYAIGGSAIVLPTPTKTNNSFAGWYSDANKTVLVGNAGASYTPTGASSGITLYAKWTSTASTVTFNANDGSGSPATSTQSISNGVATALTSNAFTRTGYTFVGWNTLANGNGTNYTNQQSVTLSENLTLYAKWTANTYTVTYNSNGGSAASNGSFTVGGDGLTLPTVTKAGYIFVGWYESADFTGAKLTSPYLPSQTRTVYARWISISPPIDVGATAGNGSVTVTWSAPASAPSEQPSAYRVEYSTTGTGSWTTADSTISSSTRSYQITGLTNNTKYYVRVAAIYSGVTGAYGYPWTLIFETTTPNRSSSSGPMTYTDTNGVVGNDVVLTRDDFSRVRYYVGAKYSSGESRRFVDINFDKGSLTNTVANSESYSNLYQLQVPATSGTNQVFEIHGNVSDLDILSNNNAVASALGRTGRLEIWPWNYGVTAETELSGGTRNASIYDDGDSWTFDDGNYGSFQLHNIGLGEAQTIFAWNRHYDTASKVEIGFGNNSSLGTHTDWTFAANFGGYSARTDFLFQSYANLSVTPIGTYVVTFNANDGSGTPSTATQSISAGTSTALNPNSFIRNGYTFSGWNTAANGSGTSYTDGQSVTISGGLTLYAQWQRISIEAAGDTHVVSGTGANTNYGTNTQLLFKNATNSTSSAFNRVAYAKFTYDAALNWSGAALEVYVSNNTDGSLNNGYNRTYTTFNVDVFAASDASWDESTLTFNLANSSNQGWGLNTAVWPWNPDTATYLGTISIPTNSSTVGQKFALSNSTLDTFLNADSDGAVTFYFRRSDVDGQANLAFASRENTSYAGPTLVVAEAGYTYTVAYDINGGTGTLPPSGTYTQGGSSYTIAATTGITAPAGKTLAGWNTAKDGSGTNFAPGASYNTASSLTLYAKYVNFPTVTFNANYVGGPSNITQQVPPSTNTALRQNSFTRTGFTFAGWDTNALGGGTAYADQANINTANGVTLYAQWTASTFTVLYNYAGRDGGDNTASASFQTGGSAITLPTPTRTGYTLDGWYVGLYDTKVGNAGASYSPTQNVTLNAKWNPINYTVTYNTTNSSGGTQPTDSANYNIGQTVTIKSNSGGLYRTGWVFNGWTQNSDGTGTVLTAGQTIQVGSSNIQLYPKWTEGTYTITYNKNSATGDLARATDTFTTGGTQVTLPNRGTLAKTGYSFSHWSETPTGSAVPDPYTTTADVTLYAVWTLANYNLAYDLNGGTGTTPTTQVANMTSSVVVAGVGDAVKSNHWFAGWNTQANGLGTTYSAGQSLLMPVGGATLYAVWVPDTYQISYNANGGTGGPVLANGFDSATFNASYSIRSKGTLARDGYNFAYWSTNQDGTGNQYDNPNDPGELLTFTPTGNTTFYAQWTPVSYTFIFNSDGGSNTYSNLSKTINQTFAMPNPGTKTGYTFSAWTDGTTQYPIGTSYRVATSGKTFTALWTANVYTVTYDWQGGTAGDGITPVVSDNYTYSANAMNLPTGTGYSRDGYTFSGWSTTTNGSTVSNFRPTSNQVLYAIWADGSYTLSYDGKGAQSGGGLGTVGKGSPVTLPTPVRAGFVFDGWFDDPTAGNRIGNGGASYTPSRSKNLYARWVQKSLYGVDLASLDTAATLSIGNDESGGSISRNHSATNTSASVVVPNGALPANTVVTARYFKEIDRQSELIPGDNNYIFSLLVSWITGSGDSATVPNTRANKPISVTLNSDAIKAGQMIYQLIGTEVTSLGRAEQDGTITVQLTQDPEIVVAATVPSAPRAVSAVAGSSQATVSWTAPQTNGGSPILNYTVTASSGAGTCTTTTTSCVITGLPDGSYTFSVTATNAVGTSASTSTSGPLTPLAPSYNVTFNSNGGSPVSGSTFQAGGSVSAPASPTRSGHTFDGWSTALDNAATKVTFPYSPPVDNDITLYALWTAAPANNAGSSGGSTPVVTPTPTPGPTPSPGTGGGSTPRPTPAPTPTAPPSQIGFKPTPPATPVVETGPVGSVVGSSEQVRVVKDAPSEKIVATAGSWQLEIKPPVTQEITKPVTEKLELQFPVAAKAQLAGTGLRPNTTVEAWVFSEPTYVGTIKVGPDGSFASSLNLPKSLLPGQHTLQIGSLNSDGKLVTLSIPITIKGSVTVGTFKGFVAIFTKDLQGQELTAKVAGKWIKQNPIKNFKTNTYSRLVRFTGAGYDILIDVYINKKFYKRYTTRTR